jgi:hypothetical protein
MRGQLPIGSVLAGYRIIELIGDGAGGAVYLAEQEERGERVAAGPSTSSSPTRRRTSTSAPRATPAT